MPLNLPGLQTDLGNVFSTGGEEAQKALEWSNALRTFTTGIAYPVLPPAQDAARAALQAALAGFNASGQAHLVIDAALSAYAAALAVGMVANGATAAVPPTPGLLAPLLLAAFSANRAGALTPAAAASVVATVIHGWFLTGTYTVGAATSPWA